MAIGEVLTIANICIAIGHMDIVIVEVLLQ